jgi:hypothetical protein
MAEDLVINKGRELFTTETETDVAVGSAVEEAGFGRVY